MGLLYCGWGVIFIALGYFFAYRPAMAVGLRKAREKWDDQHSS